MEKKKKRNPSQNELILTHLRRHKGITSAEAMTLYSVYRLSARISDLREAGYNIITNDVQGKNKYGNNTRYAMYSLVKY